MYGKCGASMGTLAIITAQVLAAASSTQVWSRSGQLHCEQCSLLSAHAQALDVGVSGLGGAALQHCEGFGADSLK